ncbi:MAG TPA: hypothetical protein VM943_11970, partial [Pyrinomonadaceae bacterium]|nr:hypothetical protein [Pyrinomonadaceae bacterium]
KDQREKIRSMNALLFLFALPLLYWQGGIESAPSLKRAGIERLCVPPGAAESWRKAGFSVIPMSEAEFAAREKLQTPGIAARANVASPTRAPWINANGWRFMRDLLRNEADKYHYDLPTGKAALATAEAFAYDADAVLKIDPADLERFGQMFAFLRQLPADDLPTLADLGVVDDGTTLAGEVMNLLARRNLLFLAAPTPLPQFPINIKLGTKEYPKNEATDPSLFALKIRRQLTDERRRLRIYGSEVVICRLTGDDSRVRLHLLNYGGREIAGLRIRLRGAYAKGEALVAGSGRIELTNYVITDGATEFSLPKMETYAWIELPSMK